MRRKLQILLVLSTWLLATGSQWDMLQVFAWGKMITTYSRTMSVKRAVILTFTPTNLCEVCQLVNDAKAKEDPARGASKAPERPVVIASEPTLVVASPVLSARVAIADLAMAGEGRPAPPLPPPRSIEV